uniref:Uncharacterized protein n=1 Tax=Lactuca sativa TaxID=4236 RepID=A0A9R1XLQ1_LACSA|nr:hypothetical protein LSAT_V11C300149520 [Lactuca sativa]
MNYTPCCAWYVRAIKKKNHQTWKSIHWVDAHYFFGLCIGNNNRSLKSLTISSYILHAIEKDVAYLVKYMQSDIKNLLNVHVSYLKACHGRRKAIKTIYGTWKSDFDELPKYIAALQASHPNIVVTWFHKPNDSSNIATFKYIFWDFGPDIDAFRLCRPVISINGCHLKGSYKGKLLVAITKDDNNNILPFAYDIINERVIMQLVLVLLPIETFCCSR